MSQKRRHSEERQDSTKKQQLGTTSSTATLPDISESQQFSPISSTSLSDTSQAYDPEEFRPLTPSADSQTESSQEISPLAPSLSPISSTSSRAYDPERDVNVSSVSLPSYVDSPTASGFQEYNPEVPLTSYSGTSGSPHGRQSSDNRSESTTETQNIQRTPQSLSLSPISSTSLSKTPQSNKCSSISSDEIDRINQRLVADRTLQNLLFDETVAEVMEYRDTISRPTPFPQFFTGITMDDYNYLMQRQPIGYSIVDNLGSGTYGAVVKAAIVVHNGFVAIKVYIMGGAVKVGRLSDEVALIRTLRETSHQNILRCFAFFKHPKNDTYYLVTEYSPLGDLYTVLQVKNNAGNSVWLPLDEAPIRHLSRGIAEGLNHLHRNCIAHGDLKLENILIFWKKNTTQQQRTTPVTDVVRHYQRLVYLWIPKLADFSNSLTHKHTDPPGEIWYNHPRCTIHYASPESWSSTTGVLPHYEAIKADAYSLGCCILALALCAHPFKPAHSLGIRWPQANDSNVIQKRVHFIRICNAMKRNPSYLQHICQHFSEQMKRVVIKLLDTNPQTRLTVNQFLTDQWITNPRSYESDAYKPVRRLKSYEY